MTTKTLPVFLLLAALPVTALSGAEDDSSWPVFGGNHANTASAGDSRISVATAAKLKLKWTFTAGADITARAAVVDGTAYFPDYAGNIWAVDTKTGRKVWGHQLSDYGLAAGTYSRTSPAVSDGLVFIGTQFNPTGPTGWLLAINARDGHLKWKMRPDQSNPSPVITSSPTTADGMVFVGMTSNEEYSAGDPSYPCCTARGSVVAVRAEDGTKLWQTFTVPPGYSGGAVWGSSPVVDEERHALIITTGNNYSAPADRAFLACVSRGGTRASCISPDDHTDSIVALNLHSGAVKWATRLTSWNQAAIGVTDGSDSWNNACVQFLSSSPLNCPAAPGPDYDFGSGANLITYRAARGPRTIVGAGQKSGIYFALDPDTGAELWHTQVGPGSLLGGMEWGSASDGTRIYVAIGNLYGIPYAAIGRPASLGAAGSWAALDPADGHIVWQVKDPNGAIDLGPLTVVNDMVLAPSMGAGATAPTMLGLNAATGSSAWSYAPGSSVIAGAVVVGNDIYWGSGYSRLALLGASGNNKLFAFTLPGADSDDDRD